MRNTRTSGTDPLKKPSENDLRRMLTGLRVLVVEDVGMVAMSLKAMLEEIGCVVVGMAARLREAEDLARHEALDGVLLDLNLGGQYAYPVGDILRDREIPFIIMSGYDAGQILPEFADVPRMQKPFEREGLEAMICSEFCARKEGGKAVPRTLSRHPVPVATGVAKGALRTRGEIEAAVCLGMCRFEQEYIGRGPSDANAHLVRELLVVRLHGVLTAAERQLAEACSPDQGRDLLKQVRNLLIESARAQIVSMIQLITGVKVVSMHHDISTRTGEEVVVFSLNEAPACREVKK
jgi:uncharacterized protein YbcI